MKSSNHKCFKNGTRDGDDGGDGGSDEEEEEEEEEAAVLKVLMMLLRKLHREGEYWIEVTLSPLHSHPSYTAS